MHNCLYAVSMHVRAYISMYVRMGGWMDGLMPGYLVDVCIMQDGCMHGWMDACKKLHVRMLVCVHVCMYVSMFVICTCLCMHARVQPVSSHDSLAHPSGTDLGILGALLFRRF